MFTIKHVLQEEAGAAGGAATGGEPQGGGTGQSALATAGQTPLHERIPEKYRVFGDAAEGSEEKPFDLEASARKMADGYDALAQKLGSGDLPPESVDGYEIDAKAIGEEFSWDDFKKEESSQAFLKRMHAKGVTNAQLQEIMEYGFKEFAPQFAEGQQALTSDGATKYLKAEIWKTDDEYKTNMGQASRFFNSLPQNLREAAAKPGSFGDDPAFIQIAALIGKEMAEDTSITETDVDTLEAERSEIEKIQLSAEYKDPKHPDYVRLSKKVQAFYAKNAARHKKAS